jgi:MFS family permease
MQNTTKDEEAKEAIRQAQKYAADRFRIGKLSNRQMFWRIIYGLPWTLLILPIFYVETESIGFTLGAFGILVGFLLLVAFGFYIADEPQFHTTVAFKNDWLDKLGALWLVAICFGPIVGYLISLFQPTLKSWRWQFSARIFLAAVLPVLLSLPLYRYARGKTALLAVPLLIGLTLLPCLTIYWTARDLAAGEKSGMLRLVKSNSYTMECESLTGEPLTTPCAKAGFKVGDVLEVYWLEHTRKILAVHKQN